ncbi:ankyrin repeat-containing domain protein [Mycena filopes]|nr:ankyrin repeat-containing domain protein [Mycena filopes]
MKLQPGRTTWLALFSRRLSWMLWEKAALKHDLDAIERFKSYVNNLLGLDIWDVAQERRLDHGARVDEDIRRWLAPYNPVPRQRALLSTRTEGTGEWLLRNDEFTDWISQAGKTLCLKGMPGAGKTVLASVIIDHLHTLFPGENAGIAYIYCNHKETQEQTAVNLVGSLWRQLSMRRAIPEDVRHCYDLFQKQQDTPTVDDVFGFLQSVVSTYPRVIIVVDAIDECTDDPSSDTRSIFLAKLRALSPTINLLLTARSHVAVEKGFTNAKCMEVRANEEDLRRYIESQIQSSERLKKHVVAKPALREQIEQTIIGHSDGMFLLAKLHMDSLRTKITPMKVREALANLPLDLKDTYADAMRRIESQSEDDRTLALQALAWVSRAFRPLSARELQEALAIQPGTLVLESDNLPDIDIVISVTMGLIVVDQTNIVRLIHHTAQTYFDDNDSPCAAAHIQLASSCLTYLSLEVFTERIFHRGLKEYPLLRYAALYWAEHARGEPALRDRILDFLASQERRHFSRQVLNTRSFAGDLVPPCVSGLWIAACLNLQDIALHFLSAGDSPDGDEDCEGNPVYIASYRGHREVVLLLLNYRGDVDGQGYYGTALQAAAGEGHAEVVRLLLERGARITPEGRRPGPLQAASNGGHVEVVRVLGGAAGVNTDDFGYALHTAAGDGNIALVKILLSLGANVDVSGGDYHTPLKAACHGGHIDTVRLLIDAGADVNAEPCGPRYRRYHTALLVAADRGHIEVLKLLIKNGARINARDEENQQTALLSACEEGRPNVARLLVEGGAICDTAGREINSLCLHAAAEKGSVEILGLLLDAGIDVNTPGGRYGSALQAAATGSVKLDAVRLLIANGADVNATGGHYGTPLQAAAAENHTSLEIIQLLIAHGASVHSQGGHYGTALQAAAYTAKGHIEAAEQAVKLLLANGANCNSQGGNYGTALQAAAAGKNLGAFQLLVDAGATVNASNAQFRRLLETTCCWGSLPAVKSLAQGGSMNTLSAEEINSLLHAASEHGNLDVVAFLLEKGADINAGGGTFGSALQAASQHGHLEVVRILINSGATLSSQGVLDGDALQRAARRGHKEVVQCLINAGANVNSHCGYYGSALQAASKMGSLEVVQLLLGQGAVINAQGGRYGTALQAAASGGIPLMGMHMMKETHPGARVGRSVVSMTMLEDSNTPVVRLLIDNGADVNIQGGYYGTALQAAAKTGDVKSVRLLLEANADVGAEGGHYGSALRAAEANGHQETIKLLLDAGAARDTTESAQPMSRRSGRRQNTYEADRSDYSPLEQTFRMQLF